MSMRSVFSRFLFTVLLSGSAWAGMSADSPRLKMVATNYPLAYFAERIGGVRVAVNLPVPPDEDPSFWKPSAKAVGEMQKAELILLNGADYEKWLPRVSLSKFRLADTSVIFKDAFIRIENAVTHSHGPGPGGMHSHDGLANNTWLDFEQAQKQAEAVAQAMIRKRPELKTVFMENLKPLQADLAELDGQLKTAAKPGQPLLGSHPVYQYLARRYGLNLKSVHWEPNEMPAPAEWEGLCKILAGHPAKVMIWEAPPSKEIAGKLKALGVESVVFDPCPNRPESGDFLGVMKKNLENLRVAMR